MPVWNREWCVRRAIDSVLAQTYRPLELIVVDDGSTDRTAEVVASYGTALRFIRQAHIGHSAARNLGLREARGELVAFADSDDAWLPEKLALQVPLMRRSEVGLVFGDCIHVAEAREGAAPTGHTSFHVSPPQRGRVAGRLAWRNFVPMCTVLARRCCLEEIGGFREPISLSADYLAWFRIALRHELDYVDRPVSLYTVHADGISADLGRSLVARIGHFSNELAQTREETVRAMLRRILFNLSLHLALAVVRGRARTVARPLRLAGRTAWQSARLGILAWTGAFVIDLMRVRARRRPA